MKLKKFSLQGFKSFADKTTLEFDGGIIAIVGPNGCGKSNIADAIRWVTGEKSAKSMRSPSMTDVIFSGTEKRKPLGFAEVTLTLTDIDDKLPTDYDSISITRRLHRSGESQYFINKNQVRLKDIEQLLAGTGIGRNSISIFEQGKIDQVIYLTPEERRVILEEVAGISRFIAQKKDSLRNLRKTEENLSRVADILTEVEKQKKNAERQAEKAAEYKEKSERLETLEIAVIVTKWHDLHGKSDKEAAEFQTLAEVLSNLTEALHEKEVALHETKQILEERREVLKRKSEAHYEAKNRREVKLETGRMNNEKLQEAAAREKELTAELDEVQKLLKGAQEEKAVQEAEQAQLESELDVKTTFLHGERESSEALEQEVASLREAFQHRQREHLRLVEQGSQTESEWREAKIRLDHLCTQRDQTHIRLGQVDSDCERLSRIVSEKQEELAAISEVVDQDKGTLEEVKASLEEMIAARQQLQKEEESLRGERSEKQARLKALLRLKEEMEGFSKGTKALMKEPKLSGKLKNLYELLVIPEDLPESAAQALKGYYQTLVVQTEGELYEVIDCARENNLKDFSLLCMEHVKGEQELSASLLNHVYVVDDPKEAFDKRHQGAAFAGRDGTFVDVSGVVFCPGKEENNVFLREAEIKELQKALEACEKALEECAAKIGALAERKMLLDQQKNELDHKVRKDEMKLVEVNFAFQNSRQTLEKLAGEKGQLKESVEKFSEQIHDLKLRIEELAEIYESAKAQAAEVTQHHQDVEATLAEKQSALRQQVELLRERESEYKILSDRCQKAAYQVGILEMRIKQMSEQIEKAQRGIDQAKVAQELLAGQDNAGSSELEELDRIVEKYANAVAVEEETIRSLMQKVHELEELVNAERVRERDLMEKKGRLEVRLSQHTSVQEALEHDLNERYNMHPKEAEVPHVEDLKEAELELKSLRRSLETMGPVNMAAIEEREEYAERYEYLSKQMADLEGSKEELMKIIGELETESRKLFEETFTQVRENFRKNFAILFRGGEADLNLVGSDDILEAGVEVSARPPGKQMRSISLLSGGEKCMTALALLFAIFEVKPAPFCVLDEIDAPLDDSNVGRFVEVLQQFTKECQFIIITHNKRTMSIADTLFGVSMPEKGVSKMLAMEFKDDKKALEPTLVEAEVHS